MRLKVICNKHADWLKQDIERREVEFKDILYNFFQDHTTLVIKKTSTE
jgi:hypothetical protein